MPRQVGNFSTNFSFLPRGGAQMKLNMRPRALWVSLPAVQFCGLSDFPEVDQPDFRSRSPIRCLAPWWRRGWLLA